jgi:hypothetical protein
MYDAGSVGTLWEPFIGGVVESGLAEGGNSRSQGSKSISVAVEAGVGTGLSGELAS